MIPSFPPNLPPNLSLLPSSTCSSSQHHRHSSIDQDGHHIPQGPPKDQLGRMLYFLSQMPSLVVEHQPAVQVGTDHWVCAGEMSVILHEGLGSQLGPAKEKPHGEGLRAGLRHASLA